MRPIVFNLAALTVAITVMLVLTRKRGLSWRDDLGLQAPRPAPAVLWFAGWLALIAAVEWVSPMLGVEPPRPWADKGPLALVLRILALGVIGPIAEELAFRGVIFGALRRRGWSLPLVIVVTAIGWALMHQQYAPVQLALIVIDGVVLGSARASTRSLWVPIAMHLTGNLFSIGQSLHFWS